MNQKLVQSLVQIILSLSDEDRQYLEREIQKYSLAKQLENLEDKLKIFEAKYQMSSQEFYRQFQLVNLRIQAIFLSGIHIMKCWI